MAAVPAPADLVAWHVSPRQTIVVPRQSADELEVIIEAYDAIPFVWPVSTGYIIGLMPRRLWMVRQ